MSLDDLGIIGEYEKEDEGLTLLVDADIVVYRPCCIFNEDDDSSRRMIQKMINQKIDQYMENAGCTKYILFFTTKFNFRDHLVEDYKENRDDVERPVNLTWAKRWCLENLNSFVRKYLEADDLLGIYMDDNTVLWSLDKDLRQIPGKHLDDATQNVITVTEQGRLEDRGKKVYFDGTIGLYYQALIGDSTDHIIGCGIRVDKVYKSGQKKGQAYVARQGIGSKKAISIIAKACIGKPVEDHLSSVLTAVINEYKSIHGDDWQSHLETQVNLLYMIREQDFLNDCMVKRWTYDNRNEWLNIDTGEIVDGYTPKPSA